MNKKKISIKISSEEIRKIRSGARRQIDIENGIGLNRKSSVFSDKKKEKNKNACRDKKEFDE